MRNLGLRRHGENIHPAYATTSGEASLARSSTDAERPGEEVSGIVKRYKKDEVAAPNVTAIGLIKSSYVDAIEYTGISNHVRGLVIFFGVFAACGLIGLGQLFLFDLIDKGLERFFDQILAFFSCVFIGLGLYFLFSAIRIEFFRPEDEPIIFDRKHRKIFRLFRQVHPGLTGLFKRWPIYAAEYDWDLIDAEHQAVLTTTGSSAMRYHSLVFIVRKSAENPTIIDSFQIGNTVQLGELSVPLVWEHIRCFMEQAGPHLPPGECLNVNKPPKTLWESWIEVGPVGPAYTRTWKSVPFFMVVYHLLFPLFVPLFFFWGIFNWLSYKTATPIAWPQEVLDAIEE